MAGERSASQSCFVGGSFMFVPSCGFLLSVVLTSPAVTSPTLQAPIVETDTSVVVKSIDTTATAVRLYINRNDGNGVVLLAGPTNPAAATTLTFNTLTLHRNEIVTATQTVGGVESSPSTASIVSVNGQLRI